MVNKRLNDTGAIQMPIPSSESSTVETSVRKIDNGYLVRTSRYGDGAYQCNERFSSEKPVIVNSFDVAEGASPDSSNSMMRAKAYLQAR